MLHTNLYVIRIAYVTWIVLMKRNHSNKELTQLQVIRKENDKLKREISQLRKQLSRIDLDRYSQVKEMIEEHYQEDRAQEGQDILDRLKKEWKCRECSAGFLEIILYSRRDGEHYYRQCNSCDHRTKGQPYVPDQVRGIVKKST